MSAEPVERVGSAAIVDHYRMRILNGELTPGTRLDPVRKIVEDWRVSRQTADKAIATLRSEGLVRTEGRAGTVVQDKEARGEVTLAVEIDNKFEVTSTDIVAASSAMARELRMNEGSSVVVIHLRHVNGQPD